MQFQSFPESISITSFDRSIIDVFTKHQFSIESKNSLISNDVLTILRKDLEGLGFKADQPGLGGKVRVPVLYGLNNLLNPVILSKYILYILSKNNLLNPVILP